MKKKTCVSFKKFACSLIRLFQIDFVFPVSLTSENLASQPKKKEMKPPPPLKKQRGRLTYREVFVKKLRGKIEKHTFLEK